MPAIPITKNRTQATAIMPYLTTGFISFFLNSNIVRGNGKIQIQPRTHNQVFLPELLVVALGLQVYPQFWYTPTVLYTSDAFRKELDKHHIVQSLSDVDHCYNNARMESFFATLKKELLYRIPTYRMTREEIKRIVFNYVFTYYNQKRIYTSNPNSLPPAANRRLFEEDIQCAA